MYEKSSKKRFIKVISVSLVEKCSYLFHFSEDLLKLSRAIVLAVCVEEFCELSVGCEERSLF